MNVGFLKFFELYKKCQLTQELFLLYLMFWGGRVDLILDTSLELHIFLSSADMDRNNILFFPILRYIYINLKLLPANV